MAARLDGRILPFSGRYLPELPPFAFRGCRISINVYFWAFHCSTPFPGFPR